MLLAARDARSGARLCVIELGLWRSSGIAKIEDVMARLFLRTHPQAQSANSTRLYLPLLRALTIGLRYFNVFGQRQDPDGDYAAVPRWIAAMLAGQPVPSMAMAKTAGISLYQQRRAGEHSAALTDDPAASINSTTWRRRADDIDTALPIATQGARGARRHASIALQYRDFRPGDVRHSLADIGKAMRLLGYAPHTGSKTGSPKQSAGMWQARRRRSRTGRPHPERTQGICFRRPDQCRRPRCCTNAIKWAIAGSSTGSAAMRSRRDSPVSIVRR